MDKNQQRAVVGVLIAAIQEKFPDVLEIKRRGEPVHDDGVWMIDVEVTKDRLFCIGYQWTQTCPYGIADNFEEEFLCFDQPDKERFPIFENMFDYMEGRLKLLAA